MLVQFLLKMPATWLFRLAMRNFFDLSLPCMSVCISNNSIHQDSLTLIDPNENYHRILIDTLSGIRQFSANHFGQCKNDFLCRLHMFDAIESRNDTIFLFISCIILHKGSFNSTPQEYASICRKVDSQQIICLSSRNLDEGRALSWCTMFHSSMEISGILYLLKCVE